MEILYEWAHYFNMKVQFGKAYAKRDMDCMARPLRLCQI
jgi:hypothetical protein